MESPPTEPPRDPIRWTVASLYARRGVLTSLAILALLSLAVGRAWDSMEGSVAASPRYALTRHSVSVTPPPPWVRDDPIERLFVASGDASAPSILADDEQLQAWFAERLSTHPWVRGIGPISKSPPNRVALEVEYRTPLAAVMLPGSMAPTDIDGVRLPAEDLARGYLKRAPRIGVAVGPESDPASKTAPFAPDGWPQRQISGAAAVIAAFGPLFAELDLYEVQVDPLPGVRAGTRFDVYRLHSIGDTVVLWGAAPGYGPPDEATFATKLARLREAVGRHGRLDSVKSSPAVIDVRNGVDAFRRVVMRKGPRLAANAEEQPTDVK